MKNMKVLIFGAGVLGSLYAARLHEAGIETALVARGQRYNDIKEHGIVLECFNTGERTTTHMRVLDKMPVDEYFDVCVVLIQKTQLDSALPALAANPHIPSFLFMNNTAEGPQVMIDALGRDRVMMGHANAGGERIGPVVHYMVAEKMPLGELDGTISSRLQQIAGAFKAAGFEVELNKNIDSWKRYHVALAVPFAYAMYKVDCCNYRLSRNRKAVRKSIQGIREAFKVLQTLGYPMEPPRFRLFFFIPDFILVPLFQWVMRMKIADIGMARHLRNAREEMDQLSKEFFALVDKSGMETPTLNELRWAADPSVLIPAAE